MAVPRRWLIVSTALCLTTNNFRYECKRTPIPPSNALTPLYPAALAFVISFLFSISFFISSSVCYSVSLFHSFLRFVPLSSFRFFVPWPPLLLCSSVPSFHCSFGSIAYSVLPFLCSSVPLFLRCSLPSFRAYLCCCRTIQLYHRAGPLGSRSPEETGTVHDRAVDVRVLLRVLRSVAAVLHYLNLRRSVPLHRCLKDIP